MINNSCNPVNISQDTTDETLELTVTGASTLCTLLSSTRISIAFIQSAFTSDSFSGSHRFSCSICLSRSDMMRYPTSSVRDPLPSAHSHARTDHQCLLPFISTCLTLSSTLRSSPLSSIKTTPPIFLPHNLSTIRPQPADRSR